MAKYYLAYGSNLHVAQMQRRCPGAKAIGTAWLEGWRLEFRGSKTGAYLTIVPDRRARTPVGVWEITDGHEDALDRYEGYPVFYYKRDFEIDMEPLRADDIPRRITGKAYIMAEDRPAGVPTQWYVDVCSIGYACFGFRKEPLLRAVSRALGAAAGKPKIKRRKKVSA